ncbi:MAG: hypothetical protein KGJ78_01385 [Alphaproteobacteria bacterium]|nr:hypothetical protein [Alphaproteobacteria bacterium]
MAGCATTKDLKAQTAAFDWSQVDKKVLVVEPDIVLSELTAGGMSEPHADWTQAARTSLAGHFDAYMHQKGVQAVDINDLNDPHEIQLLKLHGAVGAAILIHAFGPLKLPTKGTALDWTLGPGATALRDHYGADYAMFVYVRDSYASAGRQALIASSWVMCGLTGICIGVQGGSTVAFVSLVDLRTGNIVWFNVYGSGVGDLRVEKNVGPFVDSLMKDFPL